MQLAIVGAGVERKAFEQLACPLDIEVPVVFSGRVSPESVPGRLDTLALFSDTGQVSVVLLEATTARLPVARR
jgi:CheY-specific phosphatase CheX